MSRIGDFLLPCIPEEQRHEYEDELASEKGNLWSYGRTLMKILNYCPINWVVADFTSFITSILEEVERDLAGCPGSDLEKSIARLKRIFNLTDLEADLSFFFFMIDAYNGPESYFENHLKLTTFQGRGNLSTILGATRSDIDAAFYKTLAPAGLIDPSGGRINVCDEVRAFLEGPGADILTEKNLKRIKGKDTLPLDAHFIPSEDISHMLSLLDRKTDSATHFLLYGPPGTGKTSFARGLARHLNDPVYEIVSQKSEENESKRRRLVLSACVSSMNRDKGAVFIMDEADNVLNTEDAWSRRGETQDKGWLNNLMENPGLRIIWIVNHIHAIEDSVRRRFAFSIHFKSFNRQQRERLWENIVRRHRCKRYINDQDLKMLAQDFQTNAGVIDLAVKKAREAGHHHRTAMLQAIRQGVEAHQTLANGGYKKDDPASLDACYSLEGLNISADIQSVLFQAEQFDGYLKSAGNIQATYSFNLLLYGPPGTGKTEFARFLARHLDRELLARRLSDILDPYVGMTEHHIREAFDRAANTGAVLVLDEADALLFPRQGAIRSWEISHTSELLTAMERFRGVLIATTNRLDGVDSAAIRRFNHKIAFDFLTTDGNRLFYDRMLGPIASSGLNEESACALDQLRCLAPGDFKIVRDRFAFYPKDRVTPAMLIEALRQEADIKQKQSGNKTIGF
ncbi:MAG: AAA family ATPase [Thermodesulfobacteriota bacterium]